MKIYDNYTRDDTGGLEIEGEGETQINDRQDVNGSDSKPFPQERNFTRDVASTQPEGMGDFVPQTDHNNVANEFGQRKYAHREGATSIYKDETRNTVNDNEASARTEDSSVCEPEGERRGEEDY